MESYSEKPPKSSGSKINFTFINALENILVFKTLCGIVVDLEEVFTYFRTWLNYISVIQKFFYSED